MKGQLRKAAKTGRGYILPSSKLVQEAYGKKDLYTPIADLPSLSSRTESHIKDKLVRVKS